MPAARSISCATPTIYITAFQYLSDAKAFRHALAQRMRKFALELNTEKTRLIEFGRPAAPRGHAGCTVTSTRGTLPGPTGGM